MRPPQTKKPPYGGFLFVSRMGRRTRKKGLNRSKKADGSMPVCVSKFCKVGAANPCASILFFILFLFNAWFIIHMNSVGTVFGVVVDPVYSVRNSWNIVSP